MSGNGISQKEVIAFLGAPETHGGVPVEVLETHISFVFLAGTRAYKMKKAVTFSFLDYGDLEKRRQFCEIEVRTNRRTAPELYLDPVPVTLETDGALSLGGSGEPVEWLVPMRRFDNDMLLDRVAQRHGLTPRICRDLADAICSFHGAEPAVMHDDPAGCLKRVSAGISGELHRLGGDIFDLRQAEALVTRWEDLIECHSELISERQIQGHIKHLHGDLHLGNIVLIDGRPTLFDAIEFSSEIAEIDELYDLAFLLMDMIHRDHRDAANQVLNRYLGISEDHSGLALLPIFLSQRAGIRAHTTGSRPGEDKAEEARSYLRLANELLMPARPRLIAVGGPSGSGKSTAAATVAPDLGGAAGAVVLRSDVVRKVIHGLRPEDTLPGDAYRPEVSKAVFRKLAAQAETCLAAGVPVIVDAVFGRPQNLRPLEDVAHRLDLPLEGFWLSAPEEVLAQRVRDRSDDASDADELVLEKQLGSVVRPEGWTCIDASGTADESARRLAAALGSSH